MIGGATSARPTGGLATPRPGPAFLVLIACAFSAGIHFALIPGHAEESIRLGIAFGLSGVLLLGSALAIFMRPRSAIVSFATASLLASLIAAYLLSRSAGLPGLGHGVEPFDAVGVLTKLVELAALLTAVRLYTDNRSRSRPLPKRRSTK